MMSWIRDILHVLNEGSGFFLLIIAIYASRCAEETRKTRLEIECLHEDADRRYHFHDEKAMEDEIAMNEHISELLEKRS